MSSQQHTKEKMMITTIIVSGLFALGTTILAILFLAEPNAELLIFAFSLDALLFSGATVSMVSRKNKLGTGLMIAGGVTSLPIGAIAIIFAVIARKKIKKTSVNSSEFEQSAI